MEKAPVKHNRLRRMEKHDYTAACIYLITVTTADRKRVLGSLVGDSPDTARIESTALGEYVTEAFRKIAAETTKKTGCRVQVLHYQIMPDHFHGIIYVRDTLPADYALGKIIAAWKSDCTHALWSDSSFCAQNFSSEKPSLFSSGFNDRILFRKGQLQTWITYLKDNPRRLWLKKHFPNRLRKTYDFAAGKKGNQYTAVGNTFLVTYPERLQVRCHRKLTEHQNEILRRGYEYGHNRLIVGYHWYTDIEATRQFAAALVARLHADPDFLDMIAAARAEYVGVTIGVTPAGRLSPSSSPSSPQVYRLDGMPATDNTHSIVIENGQKTVRTTK